MFHALRLEVMERFSAVEDHFRSSRALRGEPSRTAKGLVFVQIYAIHEFAAKNVVRIAAADIAAHGHLYADLRPSLLSLFLDPQLRSLRDCGSGNEWEKRLALFERAQSNSPIAAVSVVPFDGSHYRDSHLVLILRVLGVSRKLVAKPRSLGYINEMVCHRNTIAHGGETAAAVGRRYSRKDIWRRIRRIRSSCLRLIDIVSQHCNVPDRHRR